MPKQILANFSISASVVELLAEAHPNSMSFKGILVRLDEPSTKAPNGANGHRIYVPTEVAQRRLKSLIGMGVNYTPTLDGHAQTRKVGVIQKAWIDGKDLWVSGTIWKHDFPEAQTDLKKKNLGMSMEIIEVHVEDPDSDIWKLTDFYFSGATILYKDAAAYYKTLAIAAKAEERSNNMKKPTAKKVVTAKGQAEPIDAQKIAEVAAVAAVGAVSKTLGPMIDRIAKTNKRQTDILASLATRVEDLESLDVEAAAEEDEEAEAVVDDMKTKRLESAKEDDDEEEDDEEACNMKSSRKKAAEDDDEDGDEDEDEDDEDEMEGTVDKGDLKDLGPNPALDENDEPGDLNEDAKNKGDKTTSENKTGPAISKGVTGSAVVALRKQVSKLTKLVNAQSDEIAGYKKRLGKFTKQVQAASSELNRRSLPAELIGLLAKQSINVDDLRTSGTKLSPEEFDGIIKACNIGLDVTKRIEFKNMLCKAGVMDEGRVERSR